jgi:hypothetical protein
MINKTINKISNRLLNTILIILIIVGLTFSVLNFLSIENTAIGGMRGSIDLDTGECVPPGNNCTPTF